MDEEIAGCQSAESIDRASQDPCENQAAYGTPCQNHTGDAVLCRLSASDAETGDALLRCFSGRQRRR